MTRARPTICLLRMDPRVYAIMWDTQELQRWWPV